MIYVRKAHLYIVYIVIPVTGHFSILEEKFGKAQSDSKLLSEFPCPIFFKSKGIK
jgi:hypothetical protein